MTEAFLSGLVAGYGIAVPVGAIAVLLASLTARTSLRVGAAAALGVATADGLYAALAVAGGAALASVVEPVAGPLRWVAAVILVGLALHTVRGALRRYREPALPAAALGRGLSTPGRAFAGLLALTLLNPLTVVYFGVLVLGRRTGSGSTIATESLFVLAAFVASASWQLLIAAGGVLIGRVLAGPRGRLATALVAGGLIIVLAVGLLE